MGPRLRTRFTLSGSVRPNRKPEHMRSFDAIVSETVERLGIQRGSLLSVWGGMRYGRGGGLNVDPERKHER